MELEEMKKIEKNHKLVQDNKWKCDKCNSTFLSIDGLCYHKMSFYKEGSKYQCPDCSYKSCHHYDIKIHIENSHKNKENLKFFQKKLESGAILYKANIFCEICKKSYISFEALKSHKENDIKAICPGPKCNFESCSDKIVLDHMQRKNCVLYDHDDEKIANHEVPKVTFKCDRCSILFDSVEEKERHMKLGLGKLKQFQCPKCEFRACHYNGAKEHFAKIHLKRPINTNPTQEKTE